MSIHTDDFGQGFAADKAAEKPRMISAAPVLKVM